MDGDLANISASVQVDDMAARATWVLRSQPVNLYASHHIMLNR